MASNEGHYPRVPHYLWGKHSSSANLSLDLIVGCSGVIPNDRPLTRMRALFWKVSWCSCQHEIVPAWNLIALTVMREMYFSGIPPIAALRRCVSSPILMIARLWSRRGRVVPKE